ncbi:MAG: hypothetical protein ABJC04_03150 [Verrucomicrobiota bacterium]
MTSISSLANTNSSSQTKLQTDALKILQNALKTEKFFVKVHAAEFLIAQGFKDEPRAIFEEELKNHESEKPYRIGIWRVLARSAKTPVEKEKWISKLRDAFMDRVGEDRSHALESLGKLNYKVSAKGDEEIENYARSHSGVERVLAEWVLALSGKADYEKALLKSCQMEDSEGRSFAAYGLRFLPNVSGEMRRQFLKLAVAEKEDSKAKIYFDGTALWLVKKSEQAKFRNNLWMALKQGTPKEKYEAGTALAGRPDKQDVPHLIPLLAEDNADARISAANAILFAIKFHRPDKNP